MTIWMIEGINPPLFFGDHDLAMRTSSEMGRTIRSLPLYTKDSDYELRRERDLIASALSKLTPEEKKAVSITAADEQFGE